MLNPARAIEDQTNTVSLVTALADYAASVGVDSASALETARHCLIDALAGGFEALREAECASLIGPLVPGAVMPGGARVPGTSLELDPAQAAFCTALILCRSPSRSHSLSPHSERAADVLGALLAVADYQGRKAVMEGNSPPRVRDLLTAIVKSLEIQGVLAREGVPDGLPIATATLRLARVAATAIATAQLGGTRAQIVMAISHACIDGGLSVDEHGFEIARRDWATADAISRAVRYACQAMACGHASYLTALDLESADLAGKHLGVRASPRRAATSGRKPFGTEIVERLDAYRTPLEVAQLTVRFRAAVDRYFPARQAEKIKALFAAPERLHDLPVNELLAALVTNGAR
jgi:hypothetical protein